MKITKTMETNIHTCRPEDTLETAAGTMLKWDIGALPVVDTRNRLVGMITDRDICMSTLIEGRHLKELPVSLAASPPAWTCGPEDTLAKVLETMQKGRVHRIPVVNEKEELVGILGLGDVARAAEDKKTGVTAADLTRTLATIREPRKLTARTETTQPVTEKTTV